MAKNGLTQISNHRQLDPQLIYLLLRQQFLKKHCADGAR